VRLRGAAPHPPQRHGLRAAPPWRRTAPLANGAHLALGAAGALSGAAAAAHDEREPVVCAGPHADAGTHRAARGATARGTDGRRCAGMGLGVLDRLPTNLHTNLPTVSWPVGVGRNWLPTAAWYVGTGRSGPVAPRRPRTQNDLEHAAALSVVRSDVRAHQGACSARPPRLRCVALLRRVLRRASPNLQGARRAYKTRQSCHIRQACHTRQYQTRQSCHIRQACHTRQSCHTEGCAAPPRRSSIAEPACVERTQGILTIIDGVTIGSLRG